MSLSEVTLLFGNHAGEIERARDYFKDETRRFVDGVRSSVAQLRSTPWQSTRVRVDHGTELIYEGKVTGYFKSQYVLVRNTVRFRKKTFFVEVAELHYGIVFDEEVGAFRWDLTLTPDVGYKTLDACLWKAWPGKNAAGASHVSETLRFIRRELGPSLTGQVANDDVKSVLEFLLQAESAIADACGVSD